MARLCDSKQAQDERLNIDMSRTKRMTSDSHEQLTGRLRSHLEKTVLPRQDRASPCGHRVDVQLGALQGNSGRNRLKDMIV